MQTRILIIKCLLLFNSSSLFASEDIDSLKKIISIQQAYLSSLKKNIKKLSDKTEKLELENKIKQLRNISNIS